ncbi:hypothetical protein BDF20DRAFT_530265 [Mycotypha africana]|uniref:uncharacterized protein n=1 Tax=Mycotypha africana TaxID=64632 RepID=UPI002301A0A7|nr:uncharacterized protein BDF20DRAFT_530265 [Mycotypha africana]KAI8979761.1 hypothetical protein BDF20DRAFT_530265 [Mycotypha africana]
MTSFGKLVRQQNLKDILESTGKDEYIIFCYDRRYLNATDEDIEALLDLESPLLDPKQPIPSPFEGDKGAATLSQLKASTSLKRTSVTDACNAFISLFSNFDSYCQSLTKAVNSYTQLSSSIIQEQKLQSMALNVAMTNLEDHRKLSEVCIKSFVATAEKELYRQTLLLSSVDNDLTILRHVKIHPSIANYLLPSPSSSNKQVKEEKSLYRFIDQDHIYQVKKDTAELCDYLEYHISVLKDEMLKLQLDEQEFREQIANQSERLYELDSILADIRILQQKLMYLRDKTKRDLKRVYDKMSRILDKPISALFASLSIHDNNINYAASISSASSNNTNTNTATNTNSAATASIMSSSSASSTNHNTTPSASTLTAINNSCLVDNGSNRHASLSMSPSSAKRILDAFYHLAEIHIKDYIPKMAAYEQTLREKTKALIGSKRHSIAMFIRNMAVVSEFQRHAGTIQPTVDEHFHYLNEFKRKYDNKDDRSKMDLEYVRNTLFSYGALMIELVRRKEYHTLLVSNSNLLADVLAQYRTEEENRRTYFRHKITKLLTPFNVSKLLENDPPSQCDINVIHGIPLVADNENETQETEQSKRKQYLQQLNKRDIADFISIITQVYSNSPQWTNSARNKSRGSNRSEATITAATKRDSDSEAEDEDNDEDEEGKPLELLQLINRMVQQVDEMGYQFLSSIKEQFFNSQQQQFSIQLKPSIIINAAGNVQEEEAQPNQLHAIIQQKHVTPSTSSSSQFSVLDNENANDDDHSENLLKAENRELKYKLEQAEEDVILLEQKQQEQADEITRLNDLIKSLENEKDEFESHRRSFLNELKNKDKSADFRIQSAEEDFRAKINDLQYELEEERHMKKNLEIEHTSELKTVKAAHEQEIEKIKQEAQQQIEQLKEELDQLKHEKEKEKQNNKTEVDKLLNALEEKHKALEAIKGLQQQTREMVKRAQDDWEFKDEELKQIKQAKQLVDSAIYDLLRRFRTSEDGDMNMIKTEEEAGGALAAAEHLESYIRQFQENLEHFEHQYDMTKQHLEEVTHELAEVTEGYTNLIDQHNEWRTIASRMAERLEDYRKHVIFEFVNQLQLPMEEEELNVLQKKLVPYDDDTIVWNQVLQLSTAIHLQKFVLRVMRKMKDTDKIAIHHFKVGDVALFLPARKDSNSNKDTVASQHPWAAFNINSPHYFLKDTNNVNPLLFQREYKEYFIARITAIEENITVAGQPETNPFNLGDNVKYHLVEVEHWRKASSSSSSSSTALTSNSLSKKRQTVHDNGLASITRSHSDTTTGGGNLEDDRPAHLQKRLSLGGTTVHSYSAGQSIN